MVQTLLIIFVGALFASAIFSTGVVFGRKRQQRRLRIITEAILCVILSILITLVLIALHALSGVKGLGAGVIATAIAMVVIEAPLVLIAIGLIFITLTGYVLFLLGVNFSRFVTFIGLDSRLQNLIHIVPSFLALIISFQYLSNIGFENIHTDEASGVLARVEIKDIKLNIPPIAGLEASPEKGRRMIAYDETRNLKKTKPDIVAATRFNRIQLRHLKIPARPEEDICFSKTNTRLDLCSGALPNKAISLSGREITRGGWDGKRIRREEGRSRRVEIEGRVYLYKNPSGTPNQRITSIEPLKIGNAIAHFQCIWWDRDLVLEYCSTEVKDSAVCKGGQPTDYKPRPECRGYLELRPGIHYEFGQVHKELLGEGDYEKALRFTVQDLTERVMDFENFVSTYGVESGSPEEGYDKFSLSLSKF